jgi:tetratricopeptide (TPR) repeat protein
MLITIGGFRLKGERNTFEMQQALNANDWNAVEHRCHQAISEFYTIDPVGLPLHWYLGKAEKKMGKPQAIESFRKAYHYAPYCKENLNDLGLAEYYTAHDLNKAEFCLKEAIRISPNYIYPYFNLAYIYLTENEPQKAKAVADSIYFDEHKREVMKADAVFFEPFNAETTRRKIDADYEATQMLYKTIFDKMKK